MKTCRTEPDDPGLRNRSGSLADNDTRRHTSFLTTTSPRWPFYRILFALTYCNALLVRSRPAWPGPGVLHGDRSTGLLLVSSIVFQLTVLLLIALRRPLLLSFSLITLSSLLKATPHTELCPPVLALCLHRKADAKTMCVLLVLLCPPPSLSLLTLVQSLSGSSSTMPAHPAPPSWPASR